MEEVRLGRQVRRLGNLIGRTIGQAQNRVGLTATQGFVLGYLFRHGGDSPLCLRDLEKKFDLTHPTVSGILSRLESGGYLTLTPDEKDRRYKRIRLLPKGVEAHRQVAVVIDQMEARLSAGFTAEELALFARFLDRAIHNLGGDGACQEGGKP